VTDPATDAWIHRLKGWAARDSNVRLALLVGSQARASSPADPFSDIDLAVFARDPGKLLRREEWVAQLAPFWTSHVEANALESGEERRVLFQDGQDVDFAVFPTRSLTSLVADPRGSQVLRRGFRVLVNKDSVELAVPADPGPPAPPSVSEFSNLANDFWFHLVWAAKKRRRGELLTALEGTNGYLRALLVRTIRWHALVVGPQGRDL
jgi:aminoglycoside 6-adenylyltransferase